MDLGIKECILYKMHQGYGVRCFDCNIFFKKYDDVNEHLKDNRDHLFQLIHPFIMPYKSGNPNDV